MHVDVDVGDSLHTLFQQPGDGDGRVVVDAEPGRAGRHGVVKAARRAEGVFGLSGQDAPRRLERRADDEGAGLVHPVEDRVVAWPVSVAQPGAVLAVACAACGVDELRRVHEFDAGVVGGLAGPHGHVRRAADLEGCDEVPREQHAIGSQGMLGAVVVDPRLGVHHEADALAHARERIAAAVRSTSVSDSPSVRQNGGPTMTRSPFVPSTCPVDE